MAAPNVESFPLDEASKIGEGMSGGIGEIRGMGSADLVKPFALVCLTGLATDEVLEDFLGAFLDGLEGGKSTALETAGAAPSEMEAEGVDGNSMDEGSEADKAEFQRCNLSLCCRAFRAALVKAWQCTQF